MKRSSKIGLGLTATLGVVVVGVAMASPYGPGRMSGGMMPGYGMQQGYGMMQGYGMQPGSGPMQGRGGWQQADPAAYFDAIARELKLTAAQEPAWNGYVTTVTAQREAFIAKREQMRSEHRVSLPTPAERITLRTTMMQERLDAMREVDAALQELTAVLTPEQLELFNRTPPLGHRMGRGAF